jgi:uncharacterized membrane protein YraQ (UPF0718 family)
MKNNLKKQESKKGFVLLGVVIVITVLISVFNPDKSSVIMETSFDYLKQMALVYPAILLLMGLFNVWVSREFVISQLGENSGLKGIAVSFVLGALPTGPIFVAFPMAAVLRKKGASYTNLVIFLSAWACIKIPQELVEMQFMGVKFMLARLLMTIVFITIMGLLINKLIGSEPISELNPRKE